MPGCPAGADPNPGLHGTWHVLTPSALSQLLLDFLKLHQPTAIAAITDSLFFVDALCELNPDPPPAFDEASFTSSLAYDVVGGGGLGLKMTQWIYEWLRYQAFLAVCTCRPITVNPTLNCLHLTSVNIPSGTQQFVPLGTITIEDQVYNSWPVDSGGNMTLGLNLGGHFTSGASGAVNWYVQFLGTDGQWVDMIRGDSYSTTGEPDRFWTIQQGLVRLPRTVQLRIRTNFGSTGTMDQFDHCFRPYPVAPQPLPPDPNFPGIPVLAPPTCSTDDLCAIVQDLSRQMTRIAVQVSDLQATVGGTDELVTLASHPISGEGELPVALGTRAVSVELTTLGPGVFTSALGRPRGLMRAGSIRWGDGQGYSKRQFIDADDFTRLRPQGGISLSWQLINGCSGTLRFLG